MYNLITGDSATGLRQIADGTVQSIVTSPPYFGLRDYDHSGQIGRESLPRDYVDNLVTVFREARRTLADNGTLWVNIGDTYQSSGGTVGVGKNASVGSTKREGSKPRIRVKTGLPDKNLVGIPWRLAFALQDDGWILRSEIIWSKSNAMPESVSDRPSRSFEYVFMLSKSKRYFYDAQAMREPRTDGKGDRAGRNIWSIPLRSGKSAGHDATFPVALPARCIAASTRPGDLVLDPFSGSGTTGVAALETGRGYVGVELNPEYNRIADARLSAVQIPLY